MKNIQRVLMAIAFVSASLTAFRAAYAAQHTSNPCKCTQDATYADDPGTTEPSCVSSFGVSWSPTQDGICNKEACPTPRPCEGTITFSASGSCTWTLSVDNGSDVVVGVFEGSFSVPNNPYSLACGSSWQISWSAGGTHLGTHTFKCKNCPSGGF